MNWILGTDMDLKTRNRNKWFFKLREEISKSLTLWSAKKPVINVVGDLLVRRHLLPIT